MPSNSILRPGDPPVLADGAMGTELMARGLPPGLPPERWLVERPGQIAAVHAAYALAGAQVLLTCTFNAASSRLGPTSPAALADLARRAVSLARSAPTTPGPARSALRVAGGLGPVALARPGGPAPGPAALRAPVAAAARALADAGVDLLWLESQYDGREAEAALEAALPLGLPVVITFTLEARGGRLVAPGGGLAEPLLLAAAHQGAAAVGVNCVAAGPALTALAAWAAASLGVPFVAKPSAGLPGALLPPAAFAEALAPALRAGARLVGGCCGAGPGHVEALAARLRDEGFG